MKIENVRQVWCSEEGSKDCKLRTRHLFPQAHQVDGARVLKSHIV